MEPTPRALELLSAVKPHLDALDVALHAHSPFDPGSARRAFRFGCTDAVAFSILPTLCTRLRQEAPDCTLSVRVADFRLIPSLLSSGEVSSALAFMREQLPAATLVSALRHSPWVVLRDKSRPRLRDLDDFCERTHALVTPSGDLGGYVDDALRSIGYRRKVALGVSSFSLLLAAIPGSDLIATVPDFVATRLAGLGSLAFDRCPVDLPPVTNTLAWRAVVDQDPAEIWFRSLVRDAFSRRAS